MELGIFLQRFKASIISKITRDKSISDDLKRTYITGFFKEDYVTEAFDDVEPDKFVHLPLNVYKYELNDLITSLSRKFRIKAKDEYLQMHADDIESFIQHYRNYPTMSEYTIPRIAMSHAIDWNNEIIRRHGDIMSFHFLHRNPQVQWNFELIDEFKDRLNWSYISSYEYLTWTPELLNRYKDYLVFSVDKTDYQKPGMNKRGETFSILHVSEFPQNPFAHLIGSISLSTAIKWSEQIIDSVIDYWDWSELCSNTSIHWTEEMIYKYRDRIDFKSLSTNSNVSWSANLLRKYENRWSWENLSANAGLPWNPDLIEQFFEKWIWKPSFNLYVNNCWRDYPSLSINEGISWSSDMIEKWKDRVDFWLIARNGKLHKEVFYDFTDDLRQKELIGWVHHRYSDWRGTEDIYQEGWQCLLENRNFSITGDLIPIFQREKIKLRFAVGHDFARTGEYAYQVLSLLELFKDCPIQDIRLSDLNANYNDWGKFFLNSEFVNESLYQLEIKPYLRDRIRQA